MRVDEFLGRAKEEGGMDTKRRRRKGRGLGLPPSTSSDCFSPRSLIARFFPAYCYSRKVGENKGMEKEMEEEEEEEEEKDEDGTELVGCPLPPLESSKVEGGRKPEDVSLNLGMGVGLVFLLTKSTIELNKMAELQKQMEAMLTDMKNEIGKKNTASSLGESNSYLITGSSGYGDNNASHCISLREDQQSSNCWETVQKAVIPEEHPNCHQSRVNQGGIVMAQLEDELEVELQRLECNMQGKNLVLLQKERTEPANGKSDLSESSTASCGQDEEESPPHGGVSPHELERRLYELIQSRQQERIAELESALECATKKLIEKEREVVWWRDTARLVSQHEESLHRLFWKKS